MVDWTQATSRERAGSAFCPEKGSFRSPHINTIKITEKVPKMRKFHPMENAKEAIRETTSALTDAVKVAMFVAILSLLIALTALSKAL